MNRLIEKDDPLFGCLIPFLKNTNITDINWNGKDLWIDDLEKGRYVSDVKLDDQFIRKFTQGLVNITKGQFNKFHPVISTETDELRISIIHEENATTGTTISIRATPAVVRMEFEGLLAEFLESIVKAGLRIVVAGMPGAGKTETLKYLTRFIADSERVFTIEDTLEIHYREINPNKDGISLKVNDQFEYVDALKAVLRQRVDRVLLSEARSVEVKYLLENLSNGASTITTLHTDTARKIPDRIYNMHPPGEDYEKVINQVYEFIDVGIVIDRYAVSGAPITRSISEIVFFDRDNGENYVIDVYKDGNFICNKIPESILRKYQSKNVKNPLGRMEKNENKKSKV